MTGQNRVHLTRLKLTDFRNYAGLAIETDQRHVVLTGENGAGKTNLLEALSFLSPGRGMRRAAYEQIARKDGAGGWSVYAEIEGAAGAVAIGTGIAADSGPAEGSQRRIRVDGEPARTSDALLEHLRVVWLTPAMDGLFSGGASDRRRFVDRMVLALDPTHGRRVSDFEKSMRGRNRLLDEGSADASWLDAIEQQMSETGIAIALARRELLSLLTALMERSSNDQSLFPDALLALEEGFGETDLQAGLAAGDLEDTYRMALAQGRPVDAAAGRTLVGPHRADLKVSHKPKSMPAEHCSTGEQKALLTGLVLAHAGLVAELNGSAPIMLLDEIAAHLDIHRRAALFDRIDALECQAWMTGTDKELFDAMDMRAQYFAVRAGEVYEETQ